MRVDLTSLDKELVRMRTSSSAARRARCRSSRRAPRRRQCARGGTGRFSWSISRCRATSSRRLRSSRMCICSPSTTCSTSSTRTAASAKRRRAARACCWRKRWRDSSPSLRAQDAGPAIRALREQADAIRSQTLEQARRMLAAGKSADEVIEYLAQHPDEPAAAFPHPGAAPGLRVRPTPHWRRPSCGSLSEERDRD